jgi:hypothetical protein
MAGKVLQSWETAIADVFGEIDAAFAEYVRVPSAELLPLPAPLTLVEDGGEDCGATGAACSRHFVVGGPAGMRTDDVIALVKAHLTAHKGWRGIGAGSTSPTVPTRACRSRPATRQRGAQSTS